MMTYATGGGYVRIRWITLRARPQALLAISRYPGGRHENDHRLSQGAVGDADAMAGLGRGHGRGQAADVARYLRGERTPTVPEIGGKSLATRSK
jgi:hypothetical protein